MRQKLFFLVWISCIAISAVAGISKQDSLKKVLANTTQDTTKVNLLIAISKATPRNDSAAKMQFAFDALTIAQKANSGKHLMDCYQQIGRVYCYVFKDYASGVNYFKQYEDAARNHHDTTRQIDALNNLLIVYPSVFDFAKGLDCGHRALQLHPEATLQSGLLSNIGLIYLSLADYTKAMEYYSRSLYVTEQDLVAKKNVSTVHDTMYLALQLMSIGDIYGKMKEYDNAVEKYDKAISLTQEQVGITMLALMGKGGIFENKGSYEEAKKMYLEALGLFRQWHHDENETKIFTALSRLHFRTADSKIAQSYADTALDLSRKHDEQSILPEVYIIRARLDKQGGKYGNAVAYLKDAIKIAGELGILESQSEALQLLSETYKAMNRPADALEAYSQYITIRDSIYNTDKAKEITRMDIESKYSTIRLGDSVKNAQQKEVYEANLQKQKVINISATVVAALLVVLSFFIYRNYSRQKKTNVVINKAHDETKKEKQVSEGLLLNILPEEVAKELRQRGDVEPKLFENVTVFFSDFVGFTLASDRMSPQELVAELHACFKAFDEIMSRYGTEKIKTVGDAYLAVSGLPEPNANHASDIISAAFEVRDFMAARKKQMGDMTFGIRIGINSGPVVAGIVGMKKFAYDIWGDTVNTAARMEQNSSDGKINISQATYELVKDKFNCTYRGEIDAKNKGLLKMYFAEGTAIAAAV